MNFHKTSFFISSRATKHVKVPTTFSEKCAKSQSKSWIICEKFLGKPSYEFFKCRTQPPEAAWDPKVGQKSSKLHLQLLYMKVSAKIRILLKVCSYPFKNSMKKRLENNFKLAIITPSQCEFFGQVFYVDIKHLVSKSKSRGHIKLTATKAAITKGFCTRSWR